jgi:hypothetical protein
MLTSSIIYVMTLFFISHILNLKNSDLLCMHNVDDSRDMDWNKIGLATFKSR